MKRTAVDVDVDVNVNVKEHERDADVEGAAAFAALPVGDAVPAVARVPDVDEDAVRARLAKPKLPRDGGRIVSGVLMGGSSAFFTLCTGGFIVMALTSTKPLLAMLPLLLVSTGIFGGLAVFTGFLASRFFRSLPPMRSIASDDELDHIDS